MDSQTIVKTLKGDSPQPPVSNARETHLHYISSTQNSSTFKDISLSSSLKPKDLTPKSQENGIGFTTDDTEISIFDAQKYFGESNDSKGEQQSSHDLLSVPRFSSVSSVDGYGRNFRTRSFHATPTASSEASRNSQTGLLANPQGSNGISLKSLPLDCISKRWSAAKKWFFRRKCCCRGEKSVQVKEVNSGLEHKRPVVLINTKKTNNLYAERDQSYKETTSESLSKNCSITDKIVEIHHIKAMAPSPLSCSSSDFSSIDAPRQQRISASGRPFIDGAASFTFPILNPSSDQSTEPALKIIVAKPIINPLEDSVLEGFQPMHELPSGSGPLSMDNPINARGPFNSIAREDDVGSDASSDLFEIESFSTQTTSYPMYRRSDSVDEDHTYNARRFTSAVDEPQTPASECYPPSEVSIDWSVGPTEGCDRASTTNLSVSASENGDVAALKPRREEAGGDEEKRKSNGLMLMSCRQEKAVSVGPKVVKYAVEGPPMFPLHVGGRPPLANKPPLGSSHSARLSLAFAA